MEMFHTAWTAARARRMFEVQGGLMASFVNGPVSGIDQLLDVSGPGIGQKGFEKFRGEPLLGYATGDAEFAG